MGVIGNGSSAIQIIPNLQKLEGVSLTCFMRSPTWISPPFGDVSMAKMGLDPNKTECKETPLKSVTGRWAIGHYSHWG